jgi:hypothetical protein
MQLYQVSFQCHYGPNSMEAGSALVVANSKECAEESVMALLNLARSRTTTQVQRIKPGIHILERRMIDRAQQAVRIKHHNEKNLEPLEHYSFNVTAHVIARNEHQAVGRLAEALHDKINRRANKHASNVVINASTVGVAQTQMKAMEQVEIYRPRTTIDGKAI